MRLRTHYLMGNDGAEIVELPYFCSIKVHRLMCLELKKYIDRISQIFSAVESARPRCSAGLKALCLLQVTMDKAKSVIQHCSESSKLYLAITANRILLRCEQIINTLESCLSQIQTMVPSLLAAKISGIISDLRDAKFLVESPEDEAGKVVLSLLRQDISVSDSINNSELEALEFAALRLNITSPLTILIEKRCIKRLLEKIHDTNPTKKKVLKYLLYLLRKYGKLIGRYQTETTLSQHEADESTAPKPPEEFNCPISMRLMYDPVVIASGRTFEHFWIERWFNEGHETCPITQMKLDHLAVTPNCVLKCLIAEWCLKHGISIPDPYVQYNHAPISLQKTSSSSSVASFGSSMKDLRLQISGVSIRSTDTNCLDWLDEKIGDGFHFGLPQLNEGSSGHPSTTNSLGTSLDCLSKLAVLSWVSQSKAVEEVKYQLKDNDQTCYSMFSSGYIKPLIRFLKDACDLCDVKAQRDGAEVLLAILIKSGSEMPPFHEDAIYVLASFLDSDLAELALKIIEVLSCQQDCNSQIVASGILPSILKVLDTNNRECNMLAIKIICNLSSDSYIGHHIAYLDCIPKLVPFLGDLDLAGYCIKIIRNLCDIEEARIAVAEANICIDSVAKLLETGSLEEQEHAVDVLLALYQERADYRQLVMGESIVQSVVNISVNGNSGGKEIAMELLQLMGRGADGHASGCSNANAGLSLDMPRSSSNQSRKKKTSSKAFQFLGRKRSVFQKSLVS